MGFIQFGGIPGLQIIYFHSENDFIPTRDRGYLCQAEFPCTTPEISLSAFAQSSAELQKGLKKGEGKALLGVQKWEQRVHPCLQSQCTQLKWEWVFPTKNNLLFSDVMNPCLKQNFDYKVAIEF